MRNEIYSHEATELVRVITTYKTLEEKQLYALFKGQDAVIKNLLSYFVKQRRIYFNSGKARYSADEYRDGKPDYGMIAAFWVLLDFIDKVDHHDAGDFPVKISFLANGELYEIVHVPYGQEHLMNHVFSEKDKSDSRRIILVDKQEQIKSIKIPNTTGFCTVDRDGRVRYYKLE